MKTSSNVSGEQRALSLALSALATAQEALAAAGDYCCAAGRYGWEGDAGKLTRRVKLLREQIEAAR